MLLCIMTRGRVGKQETLKWIPKEWEPNVRLICPAGESGDHYRNHPNIQIYSQPKTQSWGEMNYSQKFEWLTYHAFPEENNIVIMDDDLYFNRFENDDNTGKLLVIKDRQETLPMFNLMQQMSEKIALVGVHPRMMANNAKRPFEWNSKIVTIQAINRRLIPSGINLSKHPILADVELCCNLLSRGVANARITTHFVDWLPSQASGGCDYRTAEMQRDATADIASRFAPFVKQVIKRPKTAKWLGDERYDLNVRWKDMYGWGLDRRERQTAALLDERKGRNSEEEGGRES